jgi:hypothetical protein
MQVIQNTGLNRNIIDKYYTKTEIANNCINAIKNRIKIAQKDLIIEPSAGNGAFISYIKSLSNHYKFYDLAPENSEIITQDYIKLDYTPLTQAYKKIHIIGNPPFGRQSSLAIQFIKKSCEYAYSISFILPKSFKKESMKKHFSRHFHLIYEQDLPNNSFLINNTECDVPCVFQIWIKKKKLRPVMDKIEPIYYKFIKRSETPDISFRRVGVNAGHVSKTISNKSEQSHYFITFDKNIYNTQNSITELISKLKKIKFNDNNTVGPKSISKQELIKEFNIITYNSC